MKLTPQEAQRAARFETRREAEEAARGAHIPPQSVAHAEVQPGGFSFYVLLDGDGPLSAVTLREAAQNALSDTGADTLSEKGLPLSRHYCGKCWMRNARCFLDISGHCATCGAQYSAAEVRPTWATDAYAAAIRASSAFAVKYRSAFVVYQGGEPFPYKVVPAERLPRGAVALHRALPVPLKVLRETHRCVFCGEPIADDTGETTPHGLAHEACAAVSIPA